MTVLADRELFDLFADRPDLLAVVDALSVTQPRRRRRRPLALAPAAAVAAVVAVLLVAPWKSGGPSVVDRALAAVGGGPVVHAVVEYSWRNDVVVDLATGSERERVHRTEYWYDEERGAMLDRSTTDGGRSVDYLVRSGLPGRLDPALTGFATRYRDMLASGDARIVGETTVDGRPAQLIDMPSPGGGAVEEVVVDAETYLPLSFHETYAGGRRSPDWRVLTIESVQRDPSLFVARPSPPHVTTGMVSAGRAVSLAEAEEALGAPLLRPGGRAPDSIVLMQATSQLTDGSEASGVLVRMTFGALRVSLARDAGGRYALGFGDLEYPVPPEGSIALTGSDRDGWEGALRHRSYAVTLDAPEKSEVLAAARELQ